VSYSLGVDLGTTYSAAAVCDAGFAQIVSLGHHSAVVPSVIFVGEDGQTLVGGAVVHVRFDTRGPGVQAPHR
jgi:molecular chaperone DnaK (HSP70)